MTEEAISTSAPAAPAAPVESAPVAAAPAIEAPAVVAEAAPVAPEAPVVVDPAAAEAPAAEAVKHHSETKSLLSEGQFDDGAKKPDAEAKPEGDKPAEPAADAWQPIAYELAVPEDIKLDPDGMERLQGTFNKLRLSSDQAKDAVAAYYDEVRKLQASESQRHNDAFQSYRKEQQAKIIADPVLGTKEGLQTIFRMRDALVPESDKADFDAMLNVTGAGDHIATARLFYRVNEYVERRIAEALRPYQEAAPAAPGAKAPPGNGLDPSLRGMRRVHSMTTPGAR